MNSKRAPPGSNIQGIDVLSTEGKTECRVGECQEDDGAVEAGAQVEQAHDEDHRRENPCRMIQTVQLGASEHRAEGLPHVLVCPGSSLPSVEKSFRTLATLKIFRDRRKSAS